MFEKLFNKCMKNKYGKKLTLFINILRYLARLSTEIN